MNRTFTLCFLLYPIALPFGYVLVYTFYHYAVPDANSNIEYGTSKIGVVSNKQSINKTVSFLKQHANSPRAVVLSIHTYGYFYGVAIINSYNNSEFSFTLTPVEIGNGNGQWNVHWIALW